MMLISCSSERDDPGKFFDPADEGSWTYMVYLAADNDISHAALVDIDEMEEVGSSYNVNIVVQAEFSSVQTDGGGRPNHSGQGDARRSARSHRSVA